MISFVGSDSFVLALITSTSILRLEDNEGALSATEAFPQNPRAQLRIPCNFCKAIA